MSRESNNLLPARCRNLPTISDYLKSVSQYHSYPGRISNGKMFVLFGGKWVSKKEFDRLVKRPSVSSFVYNPNNIDGSVKWIYD